MAEKSLVSASLDKTPTEVSAMFDGVARRYDLTNVVLSGGQDRYWRKQARRALQLRPGERVLDIASGTGVSTAEWAKSGAYCVATDFSKGMMQASRRRSVPKVVGDAMALPFGHNVFDAVTVSYGLRNMPDTDGALQEMLRTAKPGGRLVICEFSRPANAWFRTVYLEYLMQALPRLARRLSSNPEAYNYLAESIRSWPDQRQLAEYIEAAGWSRVRWRNLTGGVVALHHAVKG